MPGTTNRELSVDHERLKYVTGLLGSQQQGLNTVLFGTFVFLMEGPFIWPRGRAIDLACWAGLVVFVAAWRRWIPKYYQKRFGHVQAHEMSAKQFAILLLVFVSLFFFGQTIARYLDPVASSFLGSVHMRMSDPSHQINLVPSFFWLASLFAGLLWRRRIDSLWLGFLGLLVFLAIALFPMWHPGAERLVMWKILNAGGFGLSLMAMGLYDHIVLVRALPKRVAEGADE